MKRKAFGFIIASLVLTIVGCIGWNLRELPQKRLLNAAEEMVFSDVDSAARLLAQVDTARLTKKTQMQYVLLRALVHEEQWYLHYADTTSCLSSTNSTILQTTKSGKTLNEISPVWNFKRRIVYKQADDQALYADSTLMHIYHYYERESLGGTAEDKDALRRFGYICLVLSRHNEKVPLLHTDKYLHLAIHCAETIDDHALAYRSYRIFGQRIEGVSQLLCITRALQHYRLSPYQTRWLLTLINDYGYAVIRNGSFDLHHFPSLERIATIVARQKEGQTPPSVCDSVFQSLDSLLTLPAPNFVYTSFHTQGRTEESDTAFTSILEIGVPVGMYEEAQRQYKEKGEKQYKPDFETVWQSAINEFDISQDTYLAAGYAMKTASLQRRLMMAVIVILMLGLLLLALLFRNWRIKMQHRHEAEHNAHLRNAEQFAERLRQKDTMISMLRGHIMEKSEILDMLEPTAGKRTVINAHNWREIEVTLDTTDNQFVSRLRAEYPKFSEEEIRLCMLTRLHLSNSALSAIYVISISAVQHRKQKLKKEGFGITDPSITFDQIIANF